MVLFHDRVEDSRGGSCGGRRRRLRRSLACFVFCGGGRGDMTWSWSCEGGPVFVVAKRRWWLVVVVWNQRSWRVRVSSYCAAVVVLVLVFVVAEADAAGAVMYSVLSGVVVAVAVAVVAVAGARRRACCCGVRDWPPLRGLKMT